MQLHIVTGIGPRTGTSATVRRIADELGVEPFGQKFPWWCVPQENPDGYWEGIIEPGDVALMAQQTGVVVAKMWPGMLRWLLPYPEMLAECRLTVCWREDRGAQMRSWKRVAQAEKAEGIIAELPRASDRARILAQSESAVRTFLDAWTGRGHPACVLDQRLETMEGYQWQR